MTWIKPAATTKKKPGKPASRAPGKGERKGISVVKTYSRHLSDKENTSADGDSVRSDESDGSPLRTSADQPNVHDTGKKAGALPKKAKLELKALARKFKEVDQWKMEFEEVTASSSSPWEAR